MLEALHSLIAAAPLSFDAGGRNLSGTGMKDLPYSDRDVRALVSDWMTLILLGFFALLNLVPYIGWQCYKLYFLLTGFVLAPASVRNSAKERAIIVARWPLYASVNFLGLYLLCRCITLMLYSIPDLHFNVKPVRYANWQQLVMISVTWPNYLSFPLYGSLTFLWMRVSFSMFDLFDLGLSPTAKRAIEVVVTVFIALLVIAYNILGLFSIGGMFYAAHMIPLIGYFPALDIFNSWYGIPSRVGMSMATAAALVMSLVFIVALVMSLVRKARIKKSTGQMDPNTVKQIVTLVKVYAAGWSFTAIWIFRIIGLAQFVAGNPYHVWNTTNRTIPEILFSLTIIGLTWPTGIALPKFLSKLAILFNPIEIAHNVADKIQSKNPSPRVGAAPGGDTELPEKVDITPQGSGDEPGSTPADANPVAASV